MDFVRHIDQHQLTAGILDPCLRTDEHTDTLAVRPSDVVQVDDDALHILFQQSSDKPPKGLRIGSSNQLTLNVHDNGTVDFPCIELHILTPPRPLSDRGWGSWSPRRSLIY